MEKFSKLDQNHRTSMKNTQSQLKDVMMWSETILKEGLHVSPSPFCIFYAQAQKSLLGVSDWQKSKFMQQRKTTDPLHTSFFWRSKICQLTNRYFTTINVKIKYLSSFFFPFVTVNVQKSELVSAFFGQRTQKKFEIAKSSNYQSSN